MRALELEEKARSARWCGNKAHAEGRYSDAIAAYNEASRLYGEAAERWTTYGNRWRNFVVVPILVIYVAIIVAVLVGWVA